MGEKKFAVWMSMRAVSEEDFIPSLLIMSHRGTVKQISIKEMEDYIALKFAGDRVPYQNIEDLKALTENEISSRVVFVECFNNCGKTIVDNDYARSYAYMRKIEKTYNFMPSVKLTPFIVEVSE